MQRLVPLSQWLVNWDPQVQYSPAPVCVLIAVFKEYLHAQVVTKKSKEIS